MIPDGRTVSPTRKGDWMQIYPSGRQYWPLDPREEDVEIEDIAHSLSLQCRFAGHIARHYSVAEHSIRAAACVRPELMPGVPEHIVRFATLMHDSPETYVVDVPRPLKRYLGAYNEIESINARVIERRFGLPEGCFEWPAVKQADETMLFTERRDLLKPPPAQWGVAQGCTAEPLQMKIGLVSPERLEEDFLAVFRCLSDGTVWFPTWAMDMVPL